VTSAASAGTNQAIVDGVQCVTGVRDVLAVVAPLDPASEPAGAEVRARDALSASARAVLDAVPVQRPAGIAGIARAAGVPALLVQQVLPPLVLHGLVEQVPDGYRLTALGAGRPARSARVRPA
jgi:DNA processing protein